VGDIEWRVFAIVASVLGGEPSELSLPLWAPRTAIARSPLATGLIPSGSLAPTTRSRRSKAFWPEGNKHATVVTLPAPERITGSRSWPVGNKHATVVTLPAPAAEPVASTTLDPVSGTTVTIPPTVAPETKPIVAQGPKPTRAVRNVVTMADWD
jgi:hypothetical protein